MNGQNTLFGLKRLIIILVITVLMVGGISVTQAAAKTAIPGDALYPLKTTLEQTRLTLTQDAGERAALKLAFAEQRLAEISKLIEEGRYGEISQAVLAFEADINSAIIEVDTIAQSEPARAADLAVEITASLTRYAQILSVMAASAPAAAQADITRAMDTTQVASGLELPSYSSDDNGNDDNGMDDINDDDSMDDINEDDDSMDDINDDDGMDDINEDDDSMDDINDDDGMDDINDDDDSMDDINEDDDSMDDINEDDDSMDDDDDDNSNDD